MNNDLTVLIVEDDPHVLLGCQQALALEDIRSEGVSSAEQALALVGDNFPGIVISDIRLPGMDGLELLKHLKARDRTLPVVLITGHGDISMAVGAMRDGAYDFMEKPFSPERLVDVARRALEQRSLAREVWSLRRQLAERDSLEGRIIGRSPAMQQLRELIANVADTSANVLIEGETGTGKELVARCLHDFNRRQYQQKFAAVEPLISAVLGTAMPDASFYLWTKVPGSDTQFARALAADYNVVVLPGSFLARESRGVNPGAGFVRIALVPPLAQCLEAAGRIQQFVSHL